MRSARSRSASTATRWRTRSPTCWRFAGAKAVIAEDEEQVDKLLGISDRVPSLRHIIYCDPRGMRKHEDPRLLPVAELVALGEAVHAGPARRLGGDGRRDARRRHRHPLHHLRHHGAAEAGDADQRRDWCGIARPTCRPIPKGPQDEYVSVLPLPWIMEQIYCVGWGLLARMKVNFVEEPETMMADFREIGPTFVLFAPRVWESIAAEVRAKVMDASPFKRRMYELGAKLGPGRRWTRASARVAADQLLFRALRDRLGFTNLTSAATGGAALGPGHLPLLPGHGRAAAADLWPDRDAGRLYRPPRRAR